MRLVAGVTQHPRFWAVGNTPFEREAAYRSLLERPLEPHQAGLLERAAQAGWVLGSSAFVGALQADARRRLTPLPRGRRPAAQDLLD